VLHPHLQGHLHWLHQHHQAPELHLHQPGSGHGLPGLGCLGPCLLPLHPQSDPRLVGLGAWPQANRPPPRRHYLHPSHVSETIQTQCTHIDEQTRQTGITRQFLKHTKAARVRGGGGAPFFRLALCSVISTFSPMALLVACMVRLSVPHRRVSLLRLNISNE
jgi:hypothetical protein